MAYEVIIVDNGSTDDTPVWLAQLSGDVRVIRNDENLGFAKACNQGAKAARGRYLVFLNNGTIPQAGWLEALVQEVEHHPEVAVVGSKLLYPNGRIQHAGVTFSRTDRSPYHLYQGFRADVPAVNRRREFQAVTAACLLVRREVFEAVGGFDEGYRNGFEDVDLCLKIRERGWHIIYQPASCLIHLESQTPGRKTHELENWLRFRACWGSQWRLADEDLLAFEDGFRCEFPSPGIVRWVPLTNEHERAAWRIVAETQRAAQHHDDDTVRRNLRHPEQWPGDASVLRWGAQVAEALGEPHLAVAFWQRVSELTADAEARLALAKAFLRAGELAQAEAQLAALEPGTGDRGEVWLVRGVLALQRQDWAQAERAFEHALAAGADCRNATLGLGMTALEQGRTERAWDLFASLLGDNPDDREALHWLLRAGTVLARWQELERVLRTFVERNPAELAFRYAWAGVLLRCGRWDEAQRQASTIRLLEPEFPGLAELEQAVRDATPTQAQPAA
jgi:tetratricopeptide (TPR) repeat protein